MMCQCWVVTPHPFPVEFTILVPFSYWGIYLPCCLRFIDLGRADRQLLHANGNSGVVSIKDVLYYRQHCVRRVTVVCVCGLCFHLPVVVEWYTELYDASIKCRHFCKGGGTVCVQQIHCWPFIDHNGISYMQ